VVSYALVRHLRWYVRRSDSLKEIKNIASPDGKHRVAIIARDDGCYHFMEEAESRDEEISKAVYWAPTYFSGIYGTAEEAERDARLIVPWLRENSN